MSRWYTFRIRLAAQAALLCLIGSFGLSGQGAGAPNGNAGQAVWRRLGGSTRWMGLPSAAGGPVTRVWFERPGVLLAALPSGQVFESGEDGEWRERRDAAVPAAAALSVEPPEVGAVIRTAAVSNVSYAAGAHFWRSDNGGRTWRNQTAWKAGSILGGPVADFAIDARDPDRVAVATSTGVWLSQDGGLSWSGRNESLPSFPARRILATPQGSSGVVIGLQEGPSRLGAWEWAPGRRDGWVAAESRWLAEEEGWKSLISRSVGASVVTAANRGTVLAGGGLDGRIWVSVDAGVNWRTYEPEEASGAVERIWISPDGRAMLAAVGAEGPGRAGRVLRSLNGGQYWDDLTANLPPGSVYGVTAEASSGALYAATESGIYLTFNSLQAPAPAGNWFPLRSGLPRGAARDVVLDAAGHHLFAAIDGFGVYVAMAPHRAVTPQLASAADFGMRSVAPGALLTLIGARLQSATANERVAPVLATAETESQVQLPFDATGETMRVTLNWGAGDVQVGLPLREAAPAILVDREGTPMILDAESGMQSDAGAPVRPGTRLQILATGLGRVEPEWPAGLAAPLQGSPKVVAPVRVSLNGQPVVVTKAILAPGYIGFYLVEIEVPALLDAGPAELWVEAAGSESNRVRVYVEQ